MRRWTVVLTALVALAAPSLAADAQTPPDLAAALSLARPPARGIAIAVGADAIHLSKGAAAPATDTPVTTIAAAFGQITHTFGDVIAVGPSTMVAINTNPVAPNPLSGIQPWDAFKMLAASLSDAQWQRLTSAGGVGMADLRSDWQRSLFASIFPHSVTIVKLPGRGLPGQELSPEDLLQCRLKLQQETDVTFQAEGMPSKSAVTGGSPTRPNSGPEYDDYGPMESSNDVQDGVALRATEPNVPKPGRLDFTAKILKVTVPLAGLKTVGDLVNRISRLTRVELYVDRRWEGRSLTIVGASEAPAADLLHAIAFCLAGTYRYLPPAFVLTDDLVGLGTRLEILRQFELASQRAVIKAQMQAGDVLTTERSFDKLPFDSQRLALTPEQIQQAEASGNQEPNTGLSLSLPFDQLTPDQQEMVKRAYDTSLAGVENYKEDQFSRDHPEILYRPTLDAPITLSTTPLVQAIVPNVDGPVDLHNEEGLFNAPPWRWKEWSAQHDQRPAGAPSLDNLLKTYKRRAAIVAPRSEAELNLIIQSMRQLNLNELWLVVFAPGIPSRTDKRPGSPLSGADLLTAALKATKGTGIRVLPVMDLLSWSLNTPPALRDRDILGEDSTFPEARDAEEDRLIGLAPTSSAEPSRYAVPPSEPTVQETLLKEVQTTAAQPGIAGLVWRRTTWRADPEEALFDPQVQIGGFGYTARMRLAFLRQAHVDPVDIDPQELPPNEINDITWRTDFEGSAATRQLQNEWRDFRISAERSLLGRLFDAAAAVQPRQKGDGVPHALPILIADQFCDYSFGSWTNPRTPPLAVPLLSFTDEKYARAAHAQSQVALLRVPPESLTDRETLARFLDRWRTSPWDGIVLDFAPEFHIFPAAPSPADPLTILTHNQSASASISPSQQNRPPA
ncbi:MAG TPA: hypothetical protein VFJ58_10000 [Armatimonadota bacterium]|nr:hypothetical protein [Armatimonadota bacterium]